MFSFIKSSLSEILLFELKVLSIVFFYNSSRTFSRGQAYCQIFTLLNPVNI